MIAIIDYGMGNVKSVQKAFEYINRQAVVTRSSKKILDASIVVLPGVGEFSTAMKNLTDLGLIKVIYKTIESGRPFLGICLGLQVLFEESEEGGCKGLGIFKGAVKKFRHYLKVPHMGWNTVRVGGNAAGSGFFRGIADDSYFYFVHSYYIETEVTGIAATTTEYGDAFASSVLHNNIFATQFHPEKSQANGLKLLENYVNNTCN